MTIRTLCSIFRLWTNQVIICLKIMSVKFLSMNFILLNVGKVGFCEMFLNEEPYKRVDVRS